MIGGNGQSHADAHIAAEAKLLGQIMKELRQCAGYTRRELASQAGVPAADVADTEHGKIRVQTLLRLMLHPVLLNLPARAAAAGIDLERWVGSGLAITATKKGGKP